jgi:hypothetical protein
MVAAALVAALACPSQPALVERFRGRTWHTAVVACDGNRRVVMRRARMRRPEHGPPSGRRITSVDGAGQRVAWGELRRAAGRTTGRIVVSRLARGRARRVHSRVVLRRPADLEVVLSTRGELGWLTRGRVLTATLRGPARVVSRRAWTGLALEDERTLRWWLYTSEPRLGYEDLRPWPAEGCPVRRRFGPEDAGDEVVATSSHFLTAAFDVVTVVRACVRATGADPVIHQTGSDDFELARVSGPWVVILSTIGSRYTGCVWAIVDVLNAVDRVLGGRHSTFGCDRARMPDQDDPLVVTGRGAPAWIVRTPERSTLFTPAGDGLIELDTAGADGITGLTASADAVQWLHDGERDRPSCTDAALAFRASAN